MPSFSERVYNFSAGPATAAPQVLEIAKNELLNYRGSGMSIIEMSHRSSLFDQVLEKAVAQARELFRLSHEYEILFLPGGATQQFAMAPMNFLKEGEHVAVVHTGRWTNSAIREIEKLGKIEIICSGEPSEFRQLPNVTLEGLSEKTSYLHYCSNNTVYGTQWKQFVLRDGIPAVIDMSSDILSREFDYSQFDLVYAGAQKNLACAGLAIVIIKKSFADSGRYDIPDFFQYRSHIKAGSRFNTPPTFNIYMASLVMDWIQSEGGIKEIERRNIEKAELLYDYIDQSKAYRCPVHPDDRSKMNVVFYFSKDVPENPLADLEASFANKAEECGLSGLAGHRSVGGFRASIYNAMPLDGVKALIKFMEEFESTL